MISEPVTPLCHPNAGDPLFQCLPEPPAISLAGPLSYAILFGALFVPPLVLQRVYGESSLISGLRLTAIPVALALLALLSGCFSDRLGARFLTVSGTLMAFASLLLLSYLFGSGSGQLLALTVLLALLGAGQGLFTAPNNSAVTGTVPAADTGEAGSLLNVMRSLGMSLGVSLTSMAVVAIPSVRERAFGNGRVARAGGQDGATSGFAALAALALLSLVRSDNRQPEDAGTDSPGLGRGQCHAGIECSEPIHAVLRERIVRANDLAKK